MKERRILGLSPMMFRYAAAAGAILIAAACHLAASLGVGPFEPRLELFVLATAVLVLVGLFEAWNFMEGRIAAIYEERRDSFDRSFQKLDGRVKQRISDPVDEGQALIDRVKKIRSQHRWLEHLGKEIFDVRAQSCRAVTAGARAYYLRAVAGASPESDSAPYDPRANREAELRDVQLLVEYRTADADDDADQDGGNGGQIDRLEGDLTSFVELAVLSETLLEDMERSQRILERYASKSTVAYVQVAPARIVRQVRLGRAADADEILRGVTRIIGPNWGPLRRLFGWKEFGWRLRDELVIARGVVEASRYDEERAVRTLELARRTRLAEALPDVLHAGSAEINVLLGERERALADLHELEKASTFMSLHCGTAIYLYRRLREDHQVKRLRQRLRERIGDVDAHVLSRL